MNMLQMRKGLMQFSSLTVFSTRGPVPDSVTEAVCHINLEAKSISTEWPDKVDLWR